VRKVGYLRAIKKTIRRLRFKASYFDYENTFDKNTAEFHRLSELVRKRAEELWPTIDQLLPDDLKGGFRFGIQPEEIAPYPAKLKELFSIKNATSNEIKRYRINLAVNKWGKQIGDTGDAGVQVAVLTEKIRQCTEHMKKNRSDKGTKRHLEALAVRRRKMMKYLRRRDGEKYYKIVKHYNIRDMVVPADPIRIIPVKNKNKPKLSQI
jgi:small subunit ribosomal protein S15